MKILTLTPTEFAANTYVCISGNEAIIIDPAVSTDVIRKAVESENATPVGIVLTHGHFDHMLTLDETRLAWNVPVYIHGNDASFLTSPTKNVNLLFLGVPRVWIPADRTISDDDPIRVGDEFLVPLHTPGHTPGSVCLLSGFGLITGDTIFAEGCGRTDLPGGDDETLADSLTYLTELDPTLKIYPGHGPSSTLGTALANLGFSME